MELWLERMIEDVAQGHEEGRSVYLVPEEALPILKKLAQDDSLSVVWRAIEKRLDVASEIHRKAILKMDRPHYCTPLDEALIVRATETSLEEEVGRLVGAIDGALEPEPWVNSALTSERRAFLKKLRSHVEAVSEAIDLINPVDGLSIFRRVRSFATEEAIFVIEEFKNDPIDSFREIAGDPRVAGIAQFATESICNQIPDLLEAVIEDVARWSEESPMIKHPNDPAAPRLRFIRSLTEHFRRRYGTPLRSAVLALTGVYFDTETLTEASIATIAP